MKNEKTMVYKQGDIDVYYYNYKEPFIDFDDGFGFVGALAYSKNRNKVQCHFCGDFFKGIRASHLGVCEGVKRYEATHDKFIATAHDYKKAVGLNISTALVGEETRVKMITGNEAVRGNVIKYNGSRRHIDKLIKVNKSRKGTKIAMETRNKRGTCPKQLLERIKDVKKEIGRTPSKRDFYKFYKGRYIGAIYQTFGSYPKAVKKAGFIPQKDLYKGNFKYTDEQLLEYLTDFYDINNRLASYSDHERGLLPAYETYTKRFGSMNKARGVAGLPSKVKVVGRRFIIDYSNCDEKYIKLSKEK